MAANKNKTYWILERRQLDALVNPKRHDIIDRLAAAGPMSIRQLAEQLAVQPTGLYHHIKKLVEVDLIIDAGIRTVGRRPEQLYDTPAPRMRLARALSESKHPQLLSEIAAAVTRQMARDFATGMKSPSRDAEGEERNLGFLRLVGRPSPAQLARINACLAEIAEVLWNSSGKDAPVVSLGWVIAPTE